MGRWDYFVVKMTMREVADNIKFASDVYEDRTLDEAIQRVLNTGRVRKEIITYLIRQNDRFFSSLVVAALGGQPKWYPVKITDDERFQVFMEDERLNSTFGVLKFDGTQSYYALDGQHRLAAIKSLTDRDCDVADDAPADFSSEEVTVLVVVPREAEEEDEFLKRYRRLFGNLNRYAKPMDQVTNIIMDEDDAFAIISRRLITDHEFFNTKTRRQRDSARIKTTKGKNLSRTDPYFTSLEALYAINIALLDSRIRRNSGWDANGEKLRDFQRFRPSEERIDALYDELVLYWDALISVLPILENDPLSMRNHDAADPNEEDDDVLLFWPIGQEILAEVARDLLDTRQEAPEIPTKQSVGTALSGLARVVWDFHTPPWRNLLLIRDNGGGWRIRNEDRAAAQRLGKRILRWQLGIDELDDDEVQELRGVWADMLLPALTDEQKAEAWTQIEGGRVTFIETE